MQGVCRGLHPDGMSSVFAFPAGRLAKWLVAVGWLVLVVAIIGANLPGKFADAEKNESTSFLPGDAESTKALEVTERLQGGEQSLLVGVEVLPSRLVEEGPPAGVGIGGHAVSVAGEDTTESRRTA